jgi:hypothetical protein
MNEKTDERPLLSTEDEAFVGRLAEQYAPPPLSAARRAALDTELRGRVGSPNRLGFERPAFVSVLVALALGGVLAVGVFESKPPEDSHPTVLLVDSPSVEAWERGLLDPEFFDDVGAGSDLDELPDDYAAIAGIFLDG